MTLQKQAEKLGISLRTLQRRRAPGGLPVKAPGRPRAMTLGEFRVLAETWGWDPKKIEKASTLSRTTVYRNLRMLREAGQGPES